MKLSQPLIVHLPDTQGVEISRYGCGNLKIGPGVFTYSRPAGHPWFSDTGTCPGATPECERICYAKRIDGPIKVLYRKNLGDDVPPIPEACKLLRIHVSGDFDTVAYIEAWIARLTERPDVTAWTYTRSWRVLSLLPALERLRRLPNMQLFASMDQSHADVPPAGWRRAWTDGDGRAGQPWRTIAHADVNPPDGLGRNQQTFDGTMSLICPEETKHKANCVECGYCFEGKSKDVTFLRH